MASGMQKPAGKILEREFPRASKRRRWQCGLERCVASKLGPALCAMSDAQAPLWLSGRRVRRRELAPRRSSMTARPLVPLPHAAAAPMRAARRSAHDCVPSRWPLDRHNTPWMVHATQDTMTLGTRCLHRGRDALFAALSSSLLPQLQHDQQVPALMSAARLTSGGPCAAARRAHALRAAASRTAPASVARPNHCARICAAHWPFVARPATGARGVQPRRPLPRRVRSR